MITIENQDFAHFRDYLEEKSPSKIFFLCDENTYEKCLVRVLLELSTDIPFEIFEIDPGEEMKNIETAAHLWSALAEHQADRRALMVNVGGGVITDLGGFVASTYKRGVSFVNMPTSLLAMCDASIGGKTGVDHAFFKNIVGTFALPEKIFAFPEFLETLPATELRSGFAEMLKHGLVADQNHWKDLISIKNLDWRKIAGLIGRSMEIKQEIVNLDFREKNIRKNLNFGHTAGHAIESAFLKYARPVPHGEAVAAGIIIETKIAELEDILPEEQAKEVIGAVTAIFPTLDLGLFSDEEMFESMQNDKKNADDRINFTLIEQIGRGIFDRYPEKSSILAGFRFYRDLHNSN